METMSKEKIEKFASKIQSARFNNFPVCCKHLFDYLKNFESDNETLQRYEADRKKWESWPGGSRSSFGADWQLPEDAAECKSLAYDIYKSVVESNDQGTGLSFVLFKNSRLEDNIYDLNSTFLSYLAEALTEIINDSSEVQKRKSAGVIQDDTTISEGVVFIIHGHDEAMKREMQLVLERLRINSVVLHEKPDRGRTIIEKLEGESEFATYAVALFSPDDITKEGELRARQNVILELGYFIGKLTRAKVRIFKRGEMEIPSDLQGVIYTKYDDEGAWKVKLIKELSAAGFNVDPNCLVESF